MRLSILNIGVALFAALLFLPLLGAVHLFDWDEINFAESAREMLISGEYFRVQINFQPFWEKPPLFIWLQTISMNFLGVNEYAARLPNAIVGILTLLVLFNIGKKYFDEKFGLLWAAAYACSFLPHLYFKSGIIDPTFNLFIFLGIYNLAKLTTIENKNKRTRNIDAFKAGLFIGLAILTKGPVAMLVVILSAIVFIMVKKRITIFSFAEIFIFFLTAGLVSVAWFGVETFKNGPWFLSEFIVYQIRLFKTQDAGHGGPFFYHFLVLYIGCFPASIYLFKAMRKYYLETNRQTNLKVWMLISFFVVLILFSIVRTKIVHYSSFCYFPLSFLAAYGIHKLIKRKTFLSEYFRWQILIVGGLISILLILLPLVMKYKKIILPYALPYIKDDFSLGNLEADVYWSGWESLIGVFYLGIILYSAFSINRKLASSVYVLFAGTAVVIQCTLYIVVPKIERFSQGAAIDFFKKAGEEDAYVRPLGYKSYAHLFYGKAKMGQPKESLDENWLLYGAIDKPVYFVSKITNKSLDTVPGIKRLGSENGFVFYRRDAVK